MTAATAEQAVDEMIELDSVEMRVRLSRIKEHVQHCSAYRNGIACPDCAPWLVLKKWLLGIWQ